MTTSQHTGLVFMRSILSFVIVLTLILPFAPLQVSGATTNTAAQQAELQSQYDALQLEINQWQGVLNDTKAKATSIKGDVTF